MAKFDAPNINVTAKTTEQNLLSIKSHLSQLSEELNVELGNMEARISALEKKMEGDK